MKRYGMTSGQVFVWLSCIGITLVMRNHHAGNAPQHVYIEDVGPTDKSNKKSSKKPNREKQRKNSDSVNYADDKKSVASQDSNEKVVHSSNSHGSTNVVYPSYTDELFYKGFGHVNRMRKYCLKSCDNLN
jgi:hypothetical protein